jgi:hypothetical protein
MAKKRIAAIKFAVMRLSDSHRDRDDECERFDQYEDAERYINTKIEKSDPFLGDRVYYIRKLFVTSEVEV